MNDSASVSDDSRVNEKKFGETIDLEGGEGDKKEAPADPFEEMTNFLKQIPPDWDMAEKHAKANLVVDSSKTVLKADEKGTYCPCCQLPYVTDD